MPPRKFYIATGLSNLDKAKELCAALEGDGLECTYKWFDLGRVTPDLWERTAKAERNSVLESEMFILLLPGKLGTHTELGMAIASNKRVIAIGAQKYFENEQDLVTKEFVYYPSVFYFLPEIERYTIEANDARYLIKVRQIVRDGHL